MLENELTLAEIGEPGKGKGRRGAKQAQAGNGKLPAKYMNPKTGETWSGHARPPAWIKDVKDRSKFLIGGATTAPTSGAKPAKKRTVPPKYRDPKTGATWTGRGLAPAWIASAKDKSKFLIESPAGEAKPEGSERAPAKGVAVKKTNGAKKATSRKSAAKPASRKSSRPAAKSKRAAAVDFPVTNEAAAAQSPEADAPAA